MIDMARSFSFTDLLNAESMKEAVKTGYSEKVDIGDILPSDDNFYDTTDVSSLKDSIFLIGVQEPVIVNISHEQNGRKYRMVSGHRRLKACTELADEGHGEFQYIPAIICDITDPDEEKAVLIMTNSTQRVLSNWEKVNQYMELKPTLKSLKEKRRVSGRSRTIAAETMGVSESQIANYNLIGTRLIQPLMDAFRADNITMELAAEAARLEPNEQEILAQIVSARGTFSKYDVNKIIGSRVIPGQQSLEDAYLKHKDSVSTEAEYKEFVTDDKNVPVTGTNSNKNLIESNEIKSSENVIETTENVPVTDTFYEQGMYERKLVDDLIREWEEYKEIFESESNTQLYKCYCILDALKAFKETMNNYIEQ
jgi:ParB-like chromosome segregation protein Spo0J